MSDESFFREVSEELRQDRIKSIWTRFGTAIIAIVVLLVLGTAAFVAWERYAESEANASGDRYLAAQDLAAEGDIDGAIASFRELASDGWGAYPDLARLSIANALASEGRAEEAVSSYEEVAADSSVSSALREMAGLRAAYLLVDSGTLADVRGKAERLTGDDNPLRYAARDAIALAAWKAGEEATARDLYQSIVEAGDAPNGIAQRAGLMLALLSDGPADTARGEANESAASTRTGAEDSSTDEAEAAQSNAAPPSDDTSPDASSVNRAADGTADPQTNASADPELGNSSSSSDASSADQPDDGAAQPSVQPEASGEAARSDADEQPEADASEIAGDEAEATGPPETVILPEPAAEDPSGSAN